jgi:hypothetical protein
VQHEYEDRDEGVARAAQGLSNATFRPCGGV